MLLASPGLFCALSPLRGTPGFDDEVRFIPAAQLLSPLGILLIQNLVWACTRGSENHNPLLKLLYFHTALEDQKDLRIYKLVSVESKGSWNIRVR